MNQMIENVLKKRIYQEGEDSWEDVCDRVSRVISDQEETYEKREEWRKKFYNLLSTKDFLPNSPTLANSGISGLLSACLVLDLDDSLESIFETLKNAAIAQSYGAGVGYNFSKLRPYGAPVAKRGKSTGTPGFISVFDFTIGDVIRQAGKRKGANLACLWYWHDDIEKFIHLKTNDAERYSHFNISVMVDDKFMKFVTSTDNIFTSEIEKQEVLKCRKIFDHIVRQAHNTGDPGLLFFDTTNKDNPLYDVCGPLESTNPCGESWLYPGELCNLGSINLVNHMKDSKINWDKLRITVESATRFLDNVIDANFYPLELIEEATKANRKIGLGVMGFADILIMLEIKYGSQESVDVAKRLMNFITSTAVKTSEYLAKEKEPFPNCVHSSFSIPRRNAVVTVQAPTGTLAILAEVSSGIEPNFSKTIVRKDEVHPDGCLMEHPLANSPYFIEAHEVGWKEHIDIQAAFQEHVENAVSKTINLPKDASMDDVKQAYIYAWQRNCKGITIYRDGSKTSQVLNKSKLQDKSKTDNGLLHRPNPTNGQMHKFNSGKGKTYVYVGRENKHPVEIFIIAGKAGTQLRTMNDWAARLVSLCLKYKIPLEEIVKTGKGMVDLPFFDLGEKYKSLPDRISRLLEDEFLTDVENDDILDDGTLDDANLCPECGIGELQVSEGRCLKCDFCGWNRC